MVLVCELSLPLSNTLRDLAIRLPPPQASGTWRRTQALHSQGSWQLYTTSCCILDSSHVHFNTLPIVFITSHPPPVSH